MPTQNPRVNVTLESTLARALNRLSRQEHKSVSGLAKELIIEALQHREDMDLSAVAAARDHSKTQWIKHEDAWK